MILTPENIATLRHAAYSSQNRRSDEPRAVVTFIGGPLDGIRLSVLQREAGSPSLGFCTVTDTGPVQAMYRDAGRGRRVFESVARVGRHPSGLGQAPHSNQPNGPRFRGR